MTKQICIVCGGRRPNENNGVRIIKIIGRPLMTIGFAHDGKCIAKTRPLVTVKRQPKTEPVNTLY